MKTIATDDKGIENETGANIWIPVMICQVILDKVWLEKNQQSQCRYPTKKMMRKRERKIQKGHWAARYHLYKPNGYCCVFINTCFLSFLSVFAFNLVDLVER